MKFGSAVSLPSHDGRLVNVKIFGDAVLSAPTQAPTLGKAMSDATATVLLPALKQQQVGLPALGASLPHFTPQIVAEANRRLAVAGVQIQSLARFDVSVPREEVAPAEAAIAAAPSPLESAASNFMDNAVSSHVPSKLNVKIGGVKLGVDAKGNVDQRGLEKSLLDNIKDRILDNVIFFGIIGLVVVLFGCVCSGIVVKVVMALN